MNTMRQKLKDLEMESLHILEMGLADAKKPVVGFSGGKDSTLVLHLARQLDDSIPGVFCNTGVEAGETIKYVRSVDNIIEAKPEPGITFWSIAEEHGWPGIKGQQCSGPKQNYCCHLLKDKPMKKLIKQNGYDFLIDGLTIDESRQHRLNLLGKT